MDCIQEFSLPSTPASQIQEQPIRLSSHMVMYMSMSMKMCPTDKPLKILRLYCPVKTIVSMDCMHTFSSQTNDACCVNSISVILSVLWRLPDCSATYRINVSTDCIYCRLKTSATVCADISCTLWPKRYNSLTSLGSFHSFLRYQH